MYARTILHGYLGRDAELITVNSNGAQCMRLNVATSTRFKPKGADEYEERVTWHKVVVWGERLIKATLPYAKKGALVFVEGVPETRTWEKEGVTREAHEVIVSHIGVLRIPPPPRAGYADAGAAPRQQSNGDARTPASRAGASSTGRRRDSTPRRAAARPSLVDQVDGDDGFDDDIPF